MKRKRRKIVVCRRLYFRWRVAEGVEKVAIGEHEREQELEREGI
jgi:hypothetical protein